MSVQGTARIDEQGPTVDLVFEGGGVKGIGLVGAYSILEERGYRPVNMAGTSAGAIVAALVAAGYSAKELYKVMSEIPFEEFKDKAWEDFIPGLSFAASLILDHGIYEGDRFLSWIRELLHGKKDPRGDEMTFGDLLRDPSIDDVRYRYKLQVIVSDVTDRRMLVLPRDAEELGYRHPDYLPVALAVRASMSIPVFFEPVTITDNLGKKHVLVDGGMLSNFPVWLFDVPPEQKAERPTFGLKLVEKDSRARMLKGGPEQASRGGLLGRLRETGTIGYLWSLVETMMEAHDRLYVEQNKFDKTIAVDTLGVGTTEFDLPKDRVKALHTSGREAAEQFLEKIKTA